MPKTIRYYVFSAGVILGLTAIAKIVSVCGSARLLLVSDPLIGLSFRYLLLYVGIAEFIIACSCLFFTAKIKLNSILIAWLSSCFLLYRFGLWWMNWQRPCHCFGNLTDAIYIQPQTADSIMKGVLAYLLIGSYGILTYQWVNGKKPTVNNSRLNNGGDLAGVS